MSLVTADGYPCAASPKHATHTLLADDCMRVANGSRICTSRRSRLSSTAGNERDEQKDGGPRRAPQARAKCRRPLGGFVVLPDSDSSLRAGPGKVRVRSAYRSTNRSDEVRTCAGTA